jgi:hypothetical protein
MIYGGMVRVKVHECCVINSSKLGGSTPCSLVLSATSQTNRLQDTRSEILFDYNIRGNLNLFHSIHYYRIKHYCHLNILLIPVIQQLKDATDQFQQKCLMSFKKNRSGVPYLKNEMSRVLVSGETDATTLQEKEECMQVFRDAAEDVLGKHHRAFLGMFKQMMVGVFGPGMEQVFSRVSPQGYSMEVGESSSAQPGTQPPLRSQPVQPPPQSVGS